MSGDAGKQGINGDNCEDNEKTLFCWEPSVFAVALQTHRRCTFVSLLLLFVCYICLFVYWFVYYACVFLSFCNAIAAAH